MQKIDWYLLKKSVSGQTTPAEEERVGEWIGRSEEHRRFYERLSVLLNRTEKERVDIDRNYRQFQQCTGQGVRPEGRQWMRYIAVAACLVAACLGVEMYRQSLSPVWEKVAVIVPGTSKAILYPGTGEPLVLNEETRKEILTDKNFSLNQQNNQVSYMVADTLCSPAEVHTLVVPHGGEFRLCLSDATQVYMNSESELSYPAVFTGKERRVTLAGEAYFRVTKSTVPFIIEINGVVIRVLGTEFNVRAYQDEANFQTTLVQGKVEVTAAGQKLYLQPGEQAVLTEKKILTKRQVDTSKYIAWKDGFVAFESERLEDIMLKLAKWYNIEIFYESPHLKDIRFTGNIDRYGEIRILLDKIEKLDVVRFTVNGHCIVVKPK